MKKEENCFISSIVGCVALHVYKEYRKSQFSNGEFVTKQEIEKFELLNFPYRFIKEFGPKIGLDCLPTRLFEGDYVFPAVNEDNIAEKLNSIETELNNFGIDISFNLYLLANDKVLTKIISRDRTVTASRITSSVVLCQRSKTNKPRNHNSSFNLLLTEEGEGKQFHCSNVLNIGKFVYHNEERFYYEKGPEELAKVINNTSGCLTGDTVGDGEAGDDPKVLTGTSERTKQTSVTWQTVYNCNACLTAFLKKSRFKNHILGCVGGHVSSMNFNKIPHIEHFETKEFPNTLLCPLVASFDTEACGNKDLIRRKNKDGTIFKSDQRREAEMVLVAVVVTVIVRPNRENDFTIYKDISMSDDELLDYSTVPREISRLLEVEDLANLHMQIEQFRTVMNTFMDMKAKILELYIELAENPVPGLKEDIKQRIETANKLLLKRRLEASRNFGVFFMQFFQALMEATKKSIAFKVKKTLKLSWKERLALLEPISKKIGEFAREGILYSKAETKSLTDRQVGFEKSILHTNNSVRQFKEFNCVICNQKLDPLYLRYLWIYYEHKSNTSPDNETDDEANIGGNNEDDDSYEMVLDGCIVRIPNKVTSSCTPQDLAPKSPHVNIWAGRNMWQVKEKLLQFFFKEMNRLKQELLVNAFRKKKQFLKEHDLQNVTEIPEKMSAQLENQAFEDVDRRYKIDNANEFVLTFHADEWMFTEPYSADQRERLIDCLYRFIEYLTVLNQLMKAFDENSSPATLCFSTLDQLVHQNASKTYFERNKRDEEEQQEAMKDYKRKDKQLHRINNRIYWFIDEESFLELGEKLLKMVGLVLENESYQKKNYTPATLYERIKAIGIDLSDAKVKEDQRLVSTTHEMRYNVLKRRLFYYFVEIYPEFEYEMRFFFNTDSHLEKINMLSNTYLDAIDVHHHHYFPRMAPIGHAHHSCNILTFVKGVPTPRIYVHNLTHYDSNFLLKMLPPDIMAHKGKNTEKQWSVIAPSGNKNKIKMLMTPFGTFSDSMNFFSSSLAAMAEQMNERDVKQLYQLHMQYFSTSLRFKGVMRRREREGNPFSFDLFKSMFRGKLIFCYDSADDIDWLMKKSKELPSIEEFMVNKMGKKPPTAEQYLNMSKIYEYFDCSSMSDLLHLYTLEDGMLLALIMSNTFQDMHDSLGLDPSNFASTAKFSYVACKRLMNLNMQTIPNGRIFNCIVEMKRAGFSMVKNQVSIASPINAHIAECQYSPNCEICKPFVKVIETEEELNSIREEVRRVTSDCKHKLRENLEKLNEEYSAEEIESNKDLLDAVANLQKFHENLKNRETNIQHMDETSLSEFMVVLQSCLIYYDENNQYGRALKQILPVGNYAWLARDVTVETLVGILDKQKTDLKGNAKARVVDFYACVDIELPTDCSNSDRQREEEFNLLVRNQTPNVFNYTEKMLRIKRCEYVRKPGKYKSVPLYKKLISGTSQMRRYWIHSSLLKMALTNGWKVTAVYNTLTFTAQKICEDYIQFNQDERMKYINSGQEFMALFHKLMNNGFYGWFCRAVENYQESRLLFSSKKSYEHFETFSEGMCSEKSLQERAMVVVQNPHDTQEDKIDKIHQLFENQIKLAEQNIQSHKHFVANCDNATQIMKSNKKIRQLDLYIKRAKIGRSEAVSMFKISEDVKARKTEAKKIECEAKGKRFYEIPRSQQPTSKVDVKSRDDVINNALYGKKNGNTSIVLFDTEDGIQSVCFGMVLCNREKINMQSKNDVAVSVLAHAKARIGEFFRVLNDCLPTRMMGASVKLMMTDTDSVAMKITYPVLLRRNAVTKELQFSGEEDRIETLSGLGSDKMKEHLETFLCGSPEMRKIVDRAHYDKGKIYYDDSRKKQVGLYTDEVPLPGLIVSFQCGGPKNYQFKKMDVTKGESSMVSKSKHKGIAKKIEVREEDYSRLILLWDKQFNANQSIKDYSLQNRHDIFKNLVEKLKTEQNLTTNKAKERNNRNKKSSPPKTANGKNSKHLETANSKLFSSHSFYTTQSGVFMTKVEKRLGVSPSDKVLFPRAHFGSYSLGSRFANAVYEFNKDVKYDELFTDSHLQKLDDFERDFLKNMDRFYPNGIVANTLIRLEESIDYKVCEAFLTRQLKINEANMKSLKHEIDRNPDGESDDE